MKGQDIGHEVLVKVAIPAKNMDVETVDGVGFDATGYDSAILAVNVGVASPAPSSFTVDVAVQDAVADTGYAASYEKDGSTLIKVPQITAAGVHYYAFNRKHLKKYMRAECIVTLTSGSSPKLPVSAIWILGGGKTNPQTVS